jgi:hypothetical protein
MLSYIVLGILLASPELIFSAQCNSNPNEMYFGVNQDVLQHQSTFRFISFNSIRTILASDYFFCRVSHLNRIVGKIHPGVREGADDFAGHARAEEI